MRQSGSRHSVKPETLELAEVPQPTVRPGHGGWCASTTASIKPQRRQERRRRVHQDHAAAHSRTRLCRPSVEQGPADWVNAAVMGNRRGCRLHPRTAPMPHAFAVPVASLRRKPEGLSFAEAASVGVTFMAAWCGLVEAGPRSPPARRW